ncbi:MAG: hypothetical protein F6K35_08795 [Okeania sp. SIO2H7]|nr:hypothetical protein [Okeania sp. SIO2H7]
MTQLYLPIAPFVVVRDGDPLAISIANRHYSRKKDTNRLCASGKRLILVHPLGLWVFAWSLQKFRRDRQQGINCALFRNESEVLSSEIILMAEKEADEKFGRQRKFTYVNPAKVKSSNPGYCFQKAGWEKAGYSQKGLLLLIKNK